MIFKPARAGALALALMSLPAHAASDVFTVNGTPLAASTPGDYLPATAAYFANGLFSAANPASSNLALFGGSPVQTGAGASGAGVPRVTVANDSFVNPVGAASIATAQASVTTTAALVLAARAGAPGSGRVAATFYNGGAVTIYLGPFGVAPSAGFALAPGATFTFNTTAAFYGVTASGTANLSILETF